MKEKAGTEIPGDGWRCVCVCVWGGGGLRGGRAILNAPLLPPE